MIREWFIFLESQNYEIKTSPVHGKGIFAKFNIEKNVNLGIAFKLKHNKTEWNDQNVTRTELGKYTNHSNNPNIKLIKQDKIIFYITIKDIKKDEELFIDYNTFPFEGKIPKYYEPYTIEFLKKNYPHLLNDPVHRWRAETGIELIHKEPTKEEQLRIWNNWNLMTPEMKKISDNKSIELFGITNKEHHNRIMKQWNIIETFIEKIKFLNLPLGKYTVFGSGPMAARGLKEANDIDILVTLDLWNTLSKTMKQEKSKLSNTPFLVYNKDNTITFWKDMYPGKWDIDKLIKTSDIIDGVPFVKLTEVYRWKKMMNRDKDKNDMLLIEKYLNRVKQ